MCTAPRIERNKRSETESVPALKRTTKTLPGIGDVCFRRNPRAKYLNIRVKLFDGVQVTVPGRMSLSRAQQYVIQKEEWIKKCLAKNRQTRVASQLPLDEPIATRYHTVLIRKTDAEDFSVKFEGRTVHFFYPEKFEVVDAQLQRGIRSALIKIYRLEAKQLLPERVKLLADRFGFSYGRVFVKNHKSRWGSCSSRNNINLSLHLMRLPDHLIDYVILHELVHTEIKNHSSEFWMRMRDVSPNCEKLRKELRRAGRDLLLL